MRKASTLVVAAGAAAALAIPAYAATSSVKVGDDYFVRDRGVPKVTVKKGTTVRWRWTGSAPHNVTVTKGPTKFRSKTMTRGSYSFKVAKRGTYRIVCTIHEPQMRMTLAVT